MLAVRGAIACAANLRLRIIGTDLRTPSNSLRKLRLMVFIVARGLRAAVP
jgi:hypothetical protein